MNIKAICCSFIASAAAVIASVQGHAYGYSYFVDEPQDYGSGDCNNLSARGDRTYPIRNGLDAMGWSGSYWTTSNAWPQDWLDPNLETGGLDLYWADAAQLSIFSGHGNSGLMAFSHGHTESGVFRCDAGPSGISLGANAGAVAANQIVVNCCYLNPNTITYVWDDGLTQIMGYGGESYSDATMLQNFWNNLASEHNVTAWLDAMEVWTGGGGYNSSAVVTNGTYDPNNPNDLTDLNNNWTYCNIRSQNCATTRNYPAVHYYYYDWRDHGCSGCSGC